MTESSKGFGGFSGLLGTGVEHVVCKPIAVRLFVVYVRPE
jgi:hypothetical protein